MPRYEYRCPADGVFEVALPMGSATPRHDCPRCALPAARVFSAPRLSAPRALVDAIDRAERSRSEPDVVPAPAARPRRPQTAAPVNPAWSQLPRP